MFIDRRKLKMATLSNSKKHFYSVATFENKNVDIIQLMNMLKFCSYFNS